jgi:hypothetical protein
MKVPLPNLDDRRWVDLVEEGRSLIPLYAPEWTDHNIHDPGITLLELFAWVAEMDIFQLNRIAERHKRKFLALVGITPDAPQPARTVLSFTLADGAAPLQFPAEVEFAGHDPFGEVTRFRTLDPLTVVPGRIERVLIKDAQRLHDMTDRLRRGESFPLFGAIPQAGAELYLGFNHAWPQGQSVNLFFNFEAKHAGAEERRRVLQELQYRRINCRPLFREFPCKDRVLTPFGVEPHPERLPPHHGVRLVWEILASKGTETAWWQLGPEEVDDDTRAMTLDGPVRFDFPVKMVKSGEGQENQEGIPRDFYYLRVRFEAGAYDAPPVLRSLALNGVRAEQAITVGTEQIIDGQEVVAVKLGIDHGVPNQELKLPVAPVQISSFRLFTFEPMTNEWRTWDVSADFNASTRTDSQILLDPTNGAITFGNGEKGRAAPLDATIFAIYRTTRAMAGNLAANTIDDLVDSAHNRSILVNFNGVKQQLHITNPIAASGGAAAETIEGAVIRAIELLNMTWRAVTLKDYEELALNTPGVRLSRATAQANLHPSFPCLKTPGMITLIILPDMPETRPAPSLGLRRAVTTFLQQRRVIGTRVEVVGPTYLEVAVRGKVKAVPGINKANLQQKIVAGLDGFLDPLRGGPEKSGWPFGRDVYRSEVMQVIGEIDGVDYVISLALIADGCEPECGNVCLSPTWLVAAGPHNIEVV